jgi:hypothetical protein
MAVLAAASVAFGCVEDRPHPPIRASAEPRTSAVPATVAAAQASASAVTSAASASPPADDAPRVYPKTRFVWIRYEPDSPGWIGFLWFGGSVRLRGRSPRPGRDCSTYYAIEPRGYVCVDGKNATLDPDDPALVKLLPYAPKLDTAWPHQYGESRDVKRYATIPSVETLKHTEWDYAGQMARVERARQGDVDPAIAGVDVSPAGKPPWDLLGIPSTIHENRDRLRLMSTVAWTDQADQDGRTWLLGHDLLWVAKDRVVPYPKVTFHGVKLGVDARLPLAFFRGKDRPQFRRDGSDFVATDKTWARLSFVELTGNRVDQAGEIYLETKDQGLWVKKTDAVVPTPQATTPWGATVGEDDATGKAPRGRATWLEASVLGGWMLAFEGTRPVYATLISPGRGGIPVPGKDPLETASTPTGIFKITGKFATATMAAPHEFIHSDVPWTQNFHGPHAIHGTYWHDDWGNKKSAGCVNVSPLDGKYLYEFTEPQAPEGWHGTRWLPELEPATTFVVHN